MVQSSLRWDTSIVLSIARQIHLIFPFLPIGRGHFTPGQVHAYLRGDDSPPNQQEIAEMVARLPSILRERNVRKRYDGFQRYFEILPRIVFLYHRGVPPSRISRDLSFLATDVGVETVIEITATLVAERLNRAS